MITGVIHWRGRPGSTYQMAESERLFVNSLRSRLLNVELFWNQCGIVRNSTGLWWNVARNLGYHLALRNFGPVGFNPEGSEPQPEGLLPALKAILFAA